MSITIAIITCLVAIISIHIHSILFYVHVDNQSNIEEILLHHSICPNVEQVFSLAMDIRAFDSWGRISQLKYIDNFSFLSNLVYYALCSDSSNKLIVVRGPHQCGKTKSLQQFLAYLRHRHAFAIDVNFAHIDRVFQKESFLSLATLQALDYVKLDFHIDDIMKLDIILRKLSYQALSKCYRDKIVSLGFQWNYKLLFNWAPWKINQQNNLQQLMKELLHNSCSNQDYFIHLLILLTALAETNQKLRPILILRDLHKSMVQPSTTNLVLNLLKQLFQFIDSESNNPFLFPVIMEMSDYAWYQLFYIQSLYFIIPKLNYDTIVMDTLTQDEMYKNTVHVYQLWSDTIFNSIWYSIGHDRGLWNQFLYRYHYLKAHRIESRTFVKTIIKQLQVESDLIVFHLLSQALYTNKTLSYAFLKQLQDNNYVLNTFDWIARTETKYFLREKIAYIDKDFNFRIQHKLYQASIESYYKRVQQDKDLNIN